MQLQLPESSLPISHPQGFAGGAADTNNFPTPCMRPQGCSTHSRCIALTPAALHPGASAPNAARTPLGAARRNPGPPPARPGKSCLPPIRFTLPVSPVIVQGCSVLLNSCCISLKSCSQTAAAAFVLFSQDWSAKTTQGSGTASEHPSSAGSRQGRLGRATTLWPQPLSLPAVGLPGKFCLKAKHEQGWTEHPHALGQHR